MRCRFRTGRSSAGLILIDVQRIKVVPTSGSETFCTDHDHGIGKQLIELLSALQADGFFQIRRHRMEARYRKPEFLLPFCGESLLRLPNPIPDLRHILTGAVNVFLVFEQLVMKATL